MCYADATYFFALLRPSHSTCTDSAKNVKKQLEKQNLKARASEAILLELLFKVEDYDLEPVRFIRDVVSLVDFYNVSDKVALKAALYIEKCNTTAADSLHIAHSTEERYRLITADGDVKDALKDIPDSPYFINLRSPDPRV